MFDLIRHPFKVIFLIFLSFLMVSCKQSPPPPTDYPNEAPVERIEIMTLESFPVPVNVVARGYLPDNCTTIDDITEERNGNTVMVKIIMARQTDKVCAKVIKPFEEVISLNVAGLLAGVYTVKVNRISDSFELGVDNIIP